VILELLLVVFEISSLVTMLVWIFYMKFVNTMEQTFKIILA